MIFLALSEWIELNLFTHAFGDSVCFIHRTATVTHTIIIAQPESFTHSFSDENFYFFTHSLFYDVFRSCLCTLHSFNFDDVLFFIFKLSFIDNVRKDLLLGWWFMFDYRYRRWIFFFSHLLIFVRQSWFNTTSEWSSGFKFDDFLLYGTSINHILFEAIRDHPLKIPYQWLFKRNIVQPLSSEFYGSLKWKKKMYWKSAELSNVVNLWHFGVFCENTHWALNLKENEWMNEILTLRLANDEIFFFLILRTMNWNGFSVFWFFLFLFIKLRIRWKKKSEKN